MTPNHDKGGEIARLSPQEVFVNALKAYAEATTNTGSVVVTDWAAVLYVEEIQPDGTLSPRYLHLVSRKSSPHALYGLVQRLWAYVQREGRA